MSATTSNNTSMLHVSNVTGSPGSSFAGLAVMAPQLIDAAQTLHLPSSPIGWVQIIFGVLALFGA